MRNHITHLGAALFISALAVACTGRNNSVGNERVAQSGGTRGVNERVSLRGCVQPAETGRGYALRHVIVVPTSAEQPTGVDGSAADDARIPRGSWVRLAAGQNMSDDLKRYLNNEVTITGDIVDSGENTIGTSGHDGKAAQEQMPAKSSMSNGDVPRVAIEKIQKIAENCAGE